MRGKKKTMFRHSWVNTTQHHRHHSINCYHHQIAAAAAVATVILLTCYKEVHSLDRCRRNAVVGHADVLSCSGGGSECSSVFSTARGDHHQHQKLPYKGAIQLSGREEERRTIRNEIQKTQLQTHTHTLRQTNVPRFSRLTRLMFSSFASTMLSSDCGWEGKRKSKEEEQQT